MSAMITAAEVAEIMDCSESMGYNIMTLNDELEAKGFITRRGRVSRKYFCERTGLMLESEVIQNAEVH